MIYRKIAIWLAWHMPKLIVYWCSVRLITSATVGEFSDQIVTDLTVQQALERWNRYRRD